ncbi:MAG: hypothetical protein KJZ65_04475 [Phycisphaerales bacterium]|nr:hypothetical protein [Phycisphaerales bacterium]
MSLSSRLAAVNRFQRSRGFKIGASIVLGVAAVALAGTLFVGVTSGGFQLPALQNVDPNSEAARVLGKAISGGNPVPVLIGGGVIVLSALLAIVWLGLGLTYVAFSLVTLLVAWPLLVFSSTSALGLVTLGASQLGWVFLLLMRVMEVIFSGSGVVVGVVRNVLHEAVRMKVSMVFIVLLILGLATLPGVLDAAQPLRYRVQSFMQYATGGTFWMLAVLTLVFGVTTLTSEQRTRVIWQTVTKPVPAWKYLLGKWIGIVALQFVLLAVCATAIFGFVEYLRAQPAIGERTAYAATEGAVSEDRLILETQVLTARKAVEPLIPLKKTDPGFVRAVEQYIENERRTNAQFATQAPDRRKVEDDLYKDYVQAYRSIDPQTEQLGETYQFTGLAEAKKRDLPITLRYRIDSGGNRPDEFFMLTILLPDGSPIIRNTGLGMNHSVSISPSYIDNEGNLFIRVYNGQLGIAPDGQMAVALNPRTITFPPGGLQVTYQAGSFRTNFVRVVAVLWLKLAFLAMLAIWASTFLSFSVASLVAISVFLMAEMAGFITKSVETYSTADHQGHTQLVKVIAAWVSTRVASIFSVYANLEPVGRLVDGRLMSWSGVIGGALVLSVATGLLYLLGVVTFRRRELAIYSGHG